jgi:hypothetical protein
MNLDPNFSPPTFESDPRFADPIATMRSVNRADNAFWGSDGPQFGDILDSINPLQHIPIVSSIYRRMTGDDLAPGARIVGGALFGGPIGFLSGLINSAIDGATGLDIGDYVLALLPRSDVPMNSAGLAMVAPEPPPAGTTTSAGHGQATQTGDTPPSDGNTVALAALQSDLRATSSTGRATPSQAGRSGNLAGSPSAAWEARPVTLQARGSGRGEQNIFPVPLPHTSGAASGPTKGDGRRSSEYSAVELASILQAYKRAGDAAAPRELSRARRVGG